MKQIARYAEQGQYTTSKNTNVQRLTNINVFQRFLYRIELLQKG